MFKYLKIVEQIQDKIHNNIYREGEKLPSIREICNIYSCSHMTAVSSFSELEKRKLVKSVERSGHFVLKRKAKIEPVSNISYADSNVSNLVSQLLLTESDPRILPLGTNVKFENYFPLKKALSLVPIKSDMFTKLYAKYSYPPGPYDLRAQVAKRLQWRDIKVLPDDMIITQGVTEGTYLSLKAITHPGDTVVISSPCFFGIINILEQLKLKVIEVPSCIENGINVSAIATVLENEEIAAGVFQSNYENPLGCISSNQTKQELVELFKSKGVYIVEDDTNGELDHQNELLSNLKTYDIDNSVVFSAGSFSKTIGPGFRVGWLVPCKNHLSKVSKIKLSTSFSGIGINEKIIELFLDEGNLYKKHLIKLRSIFQENMKEVYSSILKYKPKACKVFLPQGGFCIWLEFPPSFDAFILYKQLILEIIAITPGHIFSTKSLYTNCIRINCGIRPSSKVIDAIQLIFIKAQEQLK